MMNRTIQQKKKKKRKKKKTKTGNLVEKQIFNFEQNKPSNKTGLNLLHKKQFHTRKISETSILKLLNFSQGFIFFQKLK